MAYTQDDLDKLNAAIAAGAVLQSIAFADQTFVFHSIAEMLTVRGLMLADLSAEAAGGTRYRLAATGKGV